MALPKELEAHASEPHVAAYARILKIILNDIAKDGGSVTSVELLSKADQRSGLRKFFALEKATDADHWLAVNATVVNHAIRILAPFRRGQTLPYSLEISLNGPLDVLASYRSGLIRRAEWVVEPNTPANRDKPKQLDALKLPAVAWRHESGVTPVLLNEGFRIGVSAGQGGAGRRVTWTVFSGYQGFLFNIGPRIGKYVRAAGKLEELLVTWAQEVPREAPKPRPKPASREPEPVPEPEPVAAPPPPESRPPTGPVRGLDSAMSDLGREAAAMLGGGSTDPSKDD